MKVISAITFDAEIVFPKCGNCADSMPEGDDILYTARKITNT